MKGMNRVIRGYTFRSVLAYVEGRGADKKDAPDGRLVGGNMAGRTADALLKEFVASRRLRPNIEKATWHNSLRMPAGEDVSDEKWQAIAADYMREMGFSDAHPWCLWKHDDEGAVHIVASRIGFDGAVYLGRNENLASTRIIAVLERTHGLTLTKGPTLDADGRIVMPDARGLKKPEIDRALRTGERPARLVLQEAIDAALADDRPTTQQFIERLELAGVVVRANVASTGRMNGFSFEVAGVPLKASDLGKTYAWQRLQERIDYEQARDGPILAARRRQLADAADPGGSAVAARGVEPAAAARPGAEPAARPDGSALDAAGRVAGEPGHGSQPGGRGAEPGDAGGHQRGGADHRGAEPGQGTEEAGGPAEAAAAAVEAAPRVAARRDGGGADGAAVRLVELGAPALAPDHSAKVKAWQSQAAALGAPAYRLTLVGRGEKQPTYNYGKGKGPDGGELAYNAAEVEALIPQLRRENARGFDIYVTPLDDAAHYLVIDDMRDPGRALYAAGWTPALVQTSSAGNWQAVIKAPKQPGADEQRIANALVQQINQSHGDPKFSGVVHPFRMAGFSNRKAGRGGAFTRLVASGSRMCKQAADWLQRQRDELAQRKRAEAAAAQAAAERESQRVAFHETLEHDRVAAQSPHEAVAAEVFATEWNRIADDVQARGWKLDLSRVDYGAALRMARAGWTRQQVSGAIQAASPHLIDRHRNPRAYADTTAQKAAQQFRPAPPAPPLLPEALPPVPEPRSARLAQDTKRSSTSRPK